MAIQVTNSNFDTEVLQSGKPVLIDFYANWCMPCKMLAPVIEEISNELSDAKVCKIDIDEEPELAQRFQVMSIPTLVIMKEGKVVNTVVGARPKQEIVGMLAD